ncbi:hypothetical protein MSAN_01254700 [Mycena sanguinolenta]|uniref:Uncharacterized protein n=1 Tax=Mycena sanguinolenta TaxID=230812 RepID=A0A8H6YI46_9AGAR|nr:hypothetical protein MSAN_01254700 [Mycena sanguinolenta]
MPPRRGKAKASTAAGPPAPKRRANDASGSQKEAPPAKKARQSAPITSLSKKVIEVIELSSGSEEDSPIPSKQAAASTAADASDADDDSNGDLSDENEDESEEGEDENGNPRLPRKVRERLEYIETRTDGLTSTYLKFITRELRNYMGKGGCNSDVAADIANHCAIQAHLGRSDLGYEKRLVKRVHRMCYPGCGESDDSDDEYDDDYEIPKEICNRLSYCCSILESFELPALRKVIKKLPKYKGRRNGELDDVIEDVMAHLDDLAAKKADIMAEAAMIEKINNKVAAK